MPARSRPAPWPAGEAVSWLLGAGVVAATAWAVLAGGWVEGAGAIIVVSLAGFAEAAILARWRAGRWVAAGALPLLLVAAVVPVTVSTMPADDDTGILHVAGRYADALSGGLFAGSDWQFVVALSAVLWLCGYWLSWFCLSERRGVVATLPCYTVLAINALNAPSLARVAVPETLAAGGCLLVLAEVHLARLLGTWSARPVPVLPGVRSRFAASFVVASVGVVALAAALPPVSTRDISALFFAARVRPPQPAESGHGSPVPAAGAPVAFSDSTRPGGPLVSRPRPALTYTSDGPGSAYLRLVNDTDFSEGNWFPSAGAGVPGSGVEAIPVRGDGPLPRDREPGHGGTTVPAQPIHVALDPAGLATRDVPYLPFTGEPEAIAGAGTAREIGLTAGRPGPPLTVDQVVPDRPQPGAGTVTTTGLVATATEAQLRAAGTAYPAFVGPLRTLPPDSQGRIAAIRAMALSWTAGAGDPYDAARAVETHLRDPQAFTYDLSPPPPPAGVWPITWFLTSSHRGYCQYFASSMGAMLRSLGIPARLVNGYGPGAVSDSGHAGLSVHTLTSSDAHTWVEAYFPRYGWVPFEPTPPSALGAYQPPARGPAAAVPTPATGPSSAPAPAPTPTPAASPTPAPRAAGGPGPASRKPPLVPILAGAGGLLLVAATGVWWLRPRSLRSLWLRLRLLGRLARVRRRPAETDAAYAGRLAAALPAGRGDLGGALAEIAAVSGRAQFSSGGAAAGDEAGWRRSWSAVARVAPAALRRWLRLPGRPRPGSAGRAR